MVFLKSAKHEKPGGMALIGLALLKNKENDPKMVEAAEMIAQRAREKSPLFDIYSTGLSIIYLSSYNPGRYAAELDTLLEMLQKKQKPHGGWGYDSLETGDTSMTQYGVLGIWEAKQAGHKVPQKVVDHVADWLLKTQDPSGAWGYQGRIAKDYKLLPQTEVRHSLAAAGLGSLYICADLCGMTPEISHGNDGRPAALREIRQREPERRAKQKVDTSADLGMIRAAQGRGDGWIAKNYTIQPQMEVLYYMYALERYSSFRELAEGRAHQDPAKVEGPKWYNDGVNYLRKTQRKDGSWFAAGQCGNEVNTAFGALFLLRSTRKSIRESQGLGDGTLIGGIGVPKAGKEVLGADGQVRTKTLLGPYAAMEAAMSQQKAEDLTAAVEQFEQLKGKGSNLLTSEHQRQFRALTSNPSPEKRMAAIKMLVFTGNLNNIPTLILALDDKDPDVVLTARDGLRRLTRRFGGFGLPDNPTLEERRRAIEQWKAWYLSIRPDTEF
ncbi:MAG: hypothetical protein JW888_12620 [Pirellulales bacterium]|nr:hypothetical protein [Pirellulales bacterium]